MDNLMRKIKDDARHAAYMCNLLIAQCNSWAKPPTVEKYIACKKKNKQPKNNGEK